MKFCPYCMGEHGERGKYCCKGHAKRAAAQLASQSIGRTNARKRIMTAVRRKARHRRAWREIAMGRDVQLNLEGIFPPGSNVFTLRRARGGK